MARLAWKDEFNLNVDYIDNAHRLPEHGIIWKTDYGRIGYCVLSSDS